MNANETLAPDLPGPHCAEPDRASASVGVVVGVGAPPQSLTPALALETPLVEPAVPAPAAAAKIPAWNPEQAPAISAAQAAADFVAQIFADIAAPEPAQVLVCPAADGVTGETGSDATHSPLLGADPVALSVQSLVGLSTLKLR